jgi:hypothetical protein
VHSENAASRAELERLRARYEGAVEPPPRTKKPIPEPEPEQFALVGSGDGSLIAAAHQMRRWTRLAGCCAGCSKSANRG